MRFKDYNDFYLIYLIKEMKSEVALNIMFEKYSMFIYKKISSFKIKEKDRDDFLQEGLIILNKAIYAFDDIKFRKTFYKFFEVVLTRKFITLKNKLIKNDFVLIEEYREEKDPRMDVILENEIVYNYQNNLEYFTSEIEKNIYIAYFINNCKIEEIEKHYNYDRKAIYNAITRIKVKLKGQNNKFNI